MDERYSLGKRFGFGSQQWFHVFHDTLCTYKNFIHEILVTIVVIKKHNTLATDGTKAERAWIIRCNTLDAHWCRTIWAYAFLVNCLSVLATVT